MVRCIAFQEADAIGSLQSLAPGIIEFRFIEDPTVLEDAAC